MADADSRFVVFHITQLRFSRHFRKRPSNSPDIQGTSKKREAETSSARLPFAWFSLFAARSVRFWRPALFSGAMQRFKGFNRSFEIHSMPQPVDGPR
jgi:hypothetical protein